MVICQSLNYTIMECNINNCSGCMACLNVCPKDAISVEESAEGFILPHINEEKCIKCGLCDAVCDYKKDTHIGVDIMKAFSLTHKNKQVVKNSSSGGAFTALSDAVLEKKGVIIGVVYDKDFNVVHTIASTSDLRDNMRGSKYVQSNPGLIYRDVKELLKKQLVLFVGTPCQCAGLKSYLKKDYANLIVVDFLCHGVPSNKMFKEHIKFICKKHKGKAINYTFRTKKYGWNTSANVLTLTEEHSKHNNNILVDHTKEDSSWLTQAFLSFFSENLSIRPSCLKCPYRNNHRPSDISIGDFWQIENLTGKKNKDGVSFITANSIKGETYLREIATGVQLKEYSIEQVRFRLPKGATIIPKRYDDFWNTYQRGGYEQVVMNYFNNSTRAKIRWEVKKLVKRMRII